MTESELKNIQERVKKMERDVKDATITNPHYVLEFFTRILAEVIEKSTLRTDTPLHCDAKPTPPDGITFPD